MRRPILKLVVLAISSALSLALMDVAFRLYEDRFLIHEVDPSAERYALESAGYNDYEGFVSRHRSPGEFRILSFGDSFAESVTRPEFAYAHVIQKRLAAALPLAAGDLAPPASQMRVVNFGRHGTSFSDYAQQYRIWSEQVDFDGVLFNLYSGNDFHELSGVIFVGARQRRHRAQRSEDVVRYGPGVDIPHKFPLRSLDHLYAHYYGAAYDKASGSEAAFYRERALQHPREGYLTAQSKQLGVFRPDSMDTYADAYFWLYKLLLVAKQIEESGIPVAITLAPPHFTVARAWGDEVLERAGVGREQLLIDLPAMVLRELAKAAGFAGPILDLEPCLRQASEAGEELYWGTNSHWNVRGNELVGELIAEKLMEHWFSSEDHRAREDSCPTSIAPPPEAVARQLADSVVAIRDLLGFERTTLSTLLGQRFEQRSEVAAALLAAGYREDPVRIQGALQGFQTRQGDRMIRPLGTRQFVRPYGWAVNSSHLGESTFVVFLYRGRVTGVGRTQEPPGELVEGIGKLAEIRASTVNVVFESMIERPRTLERPDQLWVAAISPRGIFAWLPVDPESP